MNIQELREPFLFSKDQIDYIKDEKLKSFIDKKLLKEGRNVYKSKVVDENNQELLQDNQPVEQQEIQKKEIGNISAYETNSGFTSPSRDFFYCQTNSDHQLPKLSIEKLCLQKSNPNIFAVITKASSLFKEENFQLTERMCFLDYKQLSTQRLKNYLVILRMITRVDNSLYDQVKIKIYQVKALANFLQVNIEEILKRLAEGGQIYDLDLPSGKEEPVPEEVKEEDLEQEQENNPKQQEQQNNQEEEPTQTKINEQEEEYREFFKSQISNEYGYYQNYTLLKEEDKWQLRATWLDEKIEEFRTKRSTIGWVPWLEAKFSQLADLDVPIKNGRDEKAKSVFYLFDFLEKIIQKENADGEYHRDMKTQIEFQTDYPQYNIFMKDGGQPYYLNKQYADLKVKVNVRTKLCSKITQQEKETNYFLTVFEKKTFGNEKIYEKRINTRNQDLSVEEMKFHPKGGYVYLKMSLRDRNYDSFNTQFIFNVSAQYKDPLLIKRDTQFFGFDDQVAYFYKRTKAKPRVKNATKKQDKDNEGEDNDDKDDPANVVDEEADLPDMRAGLSQEESTAQPVEESKETVEGGKNNEDGQPKDEESGNEQQEEVKEILYEDVMYKYDLNDFETLKTFRFDYNDQPDSEQLRQYFNLRDSYSYIENWTSQNKFGRCSQGFYSIYEMTNATKQRQVSVFIENKRYKVVLQNDKVDDKDPNMQYCLNEKGNLLLIYHFKAGAPTPLFAVYSQGLKKKDQYDFSHTFDPLAANSKIEIDVKTRSLQSVKLHTAGNDFLVELDNKKGKNITYFFINENLIAEIQTDDIKGNEFYFKKGSLNCIFFDYKNNSFLPKINWLTYQIIAPQGEKKEWTLMTIETEVYNKQVNFSYPYAYFIYNHDQVFCKDLRQVPDKGYSYMNGFMQIGKGRRPLAILSYYYNRKQSLQIFTINSDYNSFDFKIQVHQIKTMNNNQTGNCDLSHKCRYRHYLFDHQSIPQYQKWFQQLCTTVGKLPSEIKISVKGDTLNFEKWENRICKNRLKICQFVQGNERPEYFNELTSTNQNLPDRRPTTQWLVIIQQNERVTAYHSRMRYNVKEESLQEIWSYSEEDTTLDIYNVLVDSMIPDTLELYILYQDGKMKKFSSKVNPASTYITEAPSIELTECQEQFNLLGKVKKDQAAVGGKGGGSGGQQKIDINDILQSRANFVVANRMLYSPLGIFDLTATQMVDKYRSGFKIEHSIYSSDWNTQNVQDVLISTHMAKIGVLIEHYYGVKIQTFLMLNSRVMPTFNTKEFIHPIVPIVNKEKGFTSVFTMLVNQHVQFDTNSIFKFDEWSKITLGSFPNNQPGILLKYFNGIEEKLTLEECTGDRFLNVFRFNQSKDGKYISIMGIRTGPPMVDDVTLPKEYRNKNELEGIFIYEFDGQNVKRIQTILFAEKSKYEIEQSIKDKISNPARFKREFIESELTNVFEFGEYSYNEYEYGYIPQERNFSYNSYGFDFKENSDEFKLEEYQRIKKETEIKNELAKKKGGQAAVAPDPLLEAAEQEENKPDPDAQPVPSIKGVEPVFPNFDIPSLPAWSYILKYYNKCKENLTIKQEEIPQGDLPDEAERNDYEDTKDRISKFSSSEDDYIRRVHGNLTVTISTSGSYQMINRYENRLYIFILIDGKYQLLKMKFENDFIIKNVDSNQDFILVSTEQDFRVFAIKDLYQKDGQTLISQIDYRILPFSIFASPKIEPVYCSKKVELCTPQEMTIVGVDEIKITLQKCILSGEFIIIKGTDLNDTKFIEIININSTKTKYYIEAANTLFSGCGRYIWDINKKEVYDVIDDITTLFFWPGNQVFTGMYFVQDNFNVSKDRTMLIGSGVIQLSFNFISYIIHSELCNFENMKSDGVVITKFKNIGVFENLYYKISNYQSILESIWEANRDKDPIDQFEKTSEGKSKYFRRNGKLIIDNPEGETPMEKEQRGKNEAEAFKKSVLFLNFLEIHTDETQIVNLSRYFQSFYYLKRIDEDLEKTKVLNIFQTFYSTTERRIDLISEILRYVVQTKEVLCTPHIMIKSFIDFLEHANSNIAFQDYLQNMDYQSEYMQSLEKFQLAIPEEGFKVLDHTSLQINNKFLAKAKEPGAQKSDVMMGGIFIGDLLTEQGGEIMETLSDKKYLPIMAIPFIQYLVIFQWKKVQERVKIRLLYPFFSLLFFFSLYTVNTLNYNATAEAEEISSALLIFDWMNRICVTVIIAYFLGMEIFQMTLDFKDYFSSGWNLSDLLNYLLCMMVVILDLTPAYYTDDNKVDAEQSEVLFRTRRFFATLSSILLWIKLFYFLRTFENTARLIRMIIEIVSDMSNFMIVLLICLFGFTNGFFIIQQGQEEWFVGSNIMFSMIWTYRLILGDFQLDGFDKFTGAELALAWAIFALASLFVVIVILNLLIAIMGDTFGRVLENITNLNTREKVMMISENEFVFDRNKLFKDSQCLIVIQEKNLEGAQGETWDGQINALKKQLMDKFSLVQTGISTQMGEIQKEMRKRFNENDEKSKRLNGLTDQKIKTEIDGIKTEIGELSLTTNSGNSRSVQYISNVGDTVRDLRDKMNQMQSENGDLRAMLTKLMKAQNIPVDEDNE